MYVGEDAPFDDNQSPWEIATLEVNCTGFLTEHEIKKATSRDQELQEVMNALESNEWPTAHKRYKSIASDLSVSDGILVKNGCAVIPTSLRKKTLEVAHEGHPMVAKQKSILRERVWWPGMASAAEDWVKSCQTCATNGRPEKPTPMRRVLAPQAVWETIALDFNGPYSKYGGISVLVIVDYRSRYCI